MKIQFTKFIAGVIFLGIQPTAFAQPALKDVFKNDFLIGAALNNSQFSNETNKETELIIRHFNTITAENVMKWESIHPEPERFDFISSDCYVDFGQKHGMSVIGHTLVWHNQTPGWVFKNQKGEQSTREELLEQMRKHIRAVVGRYKGRIQGWDVVNEALAEDGSLRNSPWMQIIGEDYILKAYQFAHEADPEAELYYNDFGLENFLKRKGALNLIKKLQTAGVKLAGVGLQGHYTLDFPKLKEIEETIQAFSKLGVKVMITELDVNTLPTPMQAYSAEVSTKISADPKWNPYTNGLPQNVEQQLARRYEELFKLFSRERESLSRITFWGVSDGNSWLNDWPISGRTNYPLLFDRNGRPKAAFKAIVDNHLTSVSSVN
jgi:endo-1,4-beta-xylanase